MLTKIVDAVIINDSLLTINFDEDVLGAEPVLNNEQRLLPTLPVLVEDNAQANRIDLPAPLACLQRWVGNTTQEVTDALVHTGICRCTHAHVVAKRHEVDSVLEEFCVLRGDLESDTTVAQGAQEVSRVGATHVDVPEDIVAVFGFHRSEDIRRSRC